MAKEKSCSVRFGPRFYSETVSLQRYFYLTLLSDGRKTANTNEGRPIEPLPLTRIRICNVYVSTYQYSLQYECSSKIMSLLNNELIAYTIHMSLPTSENVHVDDSSDIISFNFCCHPIGSRFARDLEKKGRAAGDRE
jgi:hypothetical protein